ncbi:uncharacterized protein P174DRAFT_253234 [Aspergillus novofumigatus IBT 16806]|uniref:Uncharacterized protein n=1 Tax=Aspergillus novofumigatus (strain IBT 16806) TaxID=1392255 RepID=A0A2I1C2L3_ASPN1|nr:uncharacterized protein P174DRAFT_253234 [Aspergillus novofumigatus IBT 16806]PKX91887.1 hypothetical protein P174DRAFT_253234 [Aspergillus novofumigatus IBT 16806]
MAESSPRSTYLVRATEPWHGTFLGVSNRISAPETSNTSVAKADPHHHQLFISLPGFYLHRSSFLLILCVLGSFLCTSSFPCSLLSVLSDSFHLSHPRSSWLSTLVIPDPINPLSYIHHIVFAAR